MRIILQQALFLENDDCYEVVNYYDGIKLKEGMAYLFSNDLVYPYRGKYVEGYSTKPGLYKYKKETHIIPIKEALWDKYSAEHIIELDPVKIIKEVNDNPEDFASKETIEEAMMHGDLLTPVLKESDDFLKHLIKRIILEKKVSISYYKTKFDKSHEFPNLRQSLDKETKMTVTNFKRWADLLGFDWEIIISDPNDPNKYKDIRIGSKDL